jgi:uncharacterized repeat protein (TIGR01451 family)
MNVKNFGPLGQSWIPRVVSIVLAFALGASALAAQSAGPFQFVEVAEENPAVKGALPARASSFVPGPIVHPRPTANLGQGYGAEAEPNGTTATATPLPSNNLVVRANLFPSGDSDFYSFTAVAGDRVYAAVMTSFSAGSSTDSQLTLLASDGTTTIEFDDDDGSFAGLSSSIAGATIPTTGTYFLKVNDFTPVTASERPYELHVRVQSGAPTPEVEGNDTPATANVLPVNGWVSGTRNPAAATEQDWFSINLNAGDTVFLSLDANPERDGVVWNARLGFALFGDAANQILVVDDAGTGDAGNVPPVPVNPSEAMFFTVKTAGTYFAFVDSASAAVGGPTATYHLSVSVHPATNEGVNCTTYTSTDVPKAIGPGTGLVSSTITVPGNPRIADVDVLITLNHTLMADIDAHVRSPAGNDNGLFTDIGATAIGGQTQMDIVFDDEAGVPPSFTVMNNVQIKPELAYRLAWFDGENAGGVWTLDLRDDTAAEGGTLTSWSLRVCEAPTLASCSVGFSPVTVFTTDFESGAAGFTHSGTADEWELGLPATVATTTANPIAGFSTCNSGVNCWKTDLDNTYNVSSSQDLLSGNINLAGLSGPVNVTWAQRFQLESANFDHVLIEARQVGVPTNALRFYDYLDATMTNAPGNPAVNIGESSGWSVFTRRIDSLAGLNTELRFHLDSDSTVNFAGLAIDDVTVTACQANVLANPTLTTQASAGVPVGGNVNDAGTLAGGSAPTGSITFNLYGPNDATCTGAVAFTANIPVAGNGVYNSGNFAPALAGTYRWTASYSGDSNNNPATSACNAPNESVVVSQATPALVTQASVGVPVGGNVNDDGTLAGGASPTGTITFNLYGPNDATCAGAVAFTANIPVAGNGVYNSGNFAPATAGTYRWVASYSGDTNNAVATSPCNSPNESVVVSQATPTLTTQASAGVTLGGNVNDDGTLAGGASPTGSITFNLYGPNDTTCAGAIAFTANIPVAGNGVYNSGNFMPTLAGLYRWVASYSGDTNNAVATSPCNSPNESVAVGLVTPTLTTQASAGVVLGGNVNDAATLAGGANPTGSITFNLYGPNDATCAGAVAFTANIPVAGNGVYNSGNFAPGAAGTYRWVASYSGDSNNGPANSPCNSPNESVVVTAPPGASVNGTKTTSPGPYAVGNNITYTIILTNSGAGVQGDNPGNEFIDVLPAQLQLVSASASSGTAVATVGTNTVTWNGSIPASGGTVTITITATILPSAAGSTVNNQGTINFDADGNGTNESTTQTDDPTVVGSGNPTGIAVPASDVTQVPMLSPYALLLLSALLAAVALMKFTRMS